MLLPGSVVAGICSAAGSRGKRVRGPLLIGTSVLFGVPNGLNVVANQAAMYQQVPAGQAGTASGLFRAAQYIGALFSASLIGLVYGHHASNGGLHELAVVFLALSAVLLAGAVLDPTIRRRDRAGLPVPGTPSGTSGASGHGTSDPRGRAGTAGREMR